MRLLTAAGVLLFVVTAIFAATGSTASAEAGAGPRIVPGSVPVKAPKPPKRCHCPKHPTTTTTEPTTTVPTSSTTDPTPSKTSAPTTTVPAVVAPTPPPPTPPVGLPPQSPTYGYGYQSYSGTYSTPPTTTAPAANNVKLDVAAPQAATPLWDEAIGEQVVLSQDAWTRLSLRAGTRIELPLLFLVGVGLFILVQALIDRRDPKVSHAPEHHLDNAVLFE